MGLPLSTRTLPRFSGWWGVAAVGTSDMLFAARAIVHVRADPPEGAKKACESRAWVHLSDPWVMSSARVELMLKLCLCMLCRGEGAPRPKLEAHQGREGEKTPGEGRIRSDSRALHSHTRGRSRSDQQSPRSN
jgi:hypothetical protein